MVLPLLYLALCRGVQAQTGNKHISHPQSPPKSLHTFRTKPLSVPLSQIRVWLKMSTPECFRRVPQSYSAFFFSLLSSCPLAASTSVAITWPYSLTRLGSIRYIQRCNPQNCQFRESDAWRPTCLVQEDQEHHVIPETRQAVKDWHLDAKTAARVGQRDFSEERPTGYTREEVVNHG